MMLSLCLSLAEAHWKAMQTPILSEHSPILLPCQLSEPASGAHYCAPALQSRRDLRALPCPCRDLQAAHLKLAKLQSDWEAREAEKAQAGKRAAASANVSTEMSSKDAAAPSEAPPSEPILPAAEHLPGAAEGMTHKLHSYCAQTCHKVWLGAILPGSSVHKCPHCMPAR